jgi:hypothetical protein
MGDIEGVGSANVAKVQDANRDHSPFWESFTWKFAESTSDRMDSILDTLLILSKLQVSITREVEITSALKFEDCNCRKRKINK